jgi:lipopolysaccharide export system permease protein
LALRIPLLYRYIFSEILVPFLLALLSFTGVLFLAKSLKLLELIVNKNVGVLEILSLFSLIIPQFLEMSIPMALLIGIILSFHRLSSESELIVMRSFGISIRQLALPIIVFSSLSLICTLCISCFIRPWANEQLSLGLFDLAKKQASSGLISGVFNNLGPITIYGEKVEDGGERVNHVIISERKDGAKPRDFIANRGRITSDQSARTIDIELYDGSMSEGFGDNYNVTYFDINKISLNEEELLNDDDFKSGQKANEMSTSTLLEAWNKVLSTTEDGESLSTKKILQGARYGVEFHRRFSLPFICIVVGIIGLALGIQPARGSRTWTGAISMSLGIATITIYYFALAFATALGEQAIMPAGMILWAPNILFGFIAYWLFRMLENESSFGVTDTLISFCNQHLSNFRNRK